MEDAFAAAVLAAIALLPVANLVSREFFGGGIPGAISAVQHLTLWITFIGAAIAARSDRLLALATTEFMTRQWQHRVKRLTAFLAVAVASTLTVASIQLVRVDAEYGDTIAWGIPVWIVSLVMPIVFALIAYRLMTAAAADWREGFLISSGIAVPVLFYFVPALNAQALLLPGIGVLVVATALGLPIMIAIGGAATLLFFLEGTPIAAVPGEAYRMAT